MTDVMLPTHSYKQGKNAANAEFRRLRSGIGDAIGVESYRYAGDDEDALAEWTVRTDLETVTAAIEALIAADGGTLIFGSNRTYDLSGLAGAYILPSNTRIVGNGAVLDARDSEIVFVFSIAGEVGDEVPLGADALFGAEYIDLADDDIAEQEIEVGTWLEIGSDIKYVTLEDTQTPLIGQSNRVIKFGASDVPDHTRVYLDTLIFSDIGGAKAWAPRYVLHYNGSSYTTLANTYDRDYVTGDTFDFDVGDYLYIGHRSPFDTVNLRFQTYAAAGAQVLGAEYWDGSTWASAGVYEDTTEGFTQHGSIRHAARWHLSLVDPTNWETTIVDGKGGTPALYWLRLTLSGADINTLELREVSVVTCSGYLMVDGAYAKVRTPIDYVSARDLKILANPNATAIRLYYAHHCRFDNVDIVGGGGYSLTIYGCEGTVVSRCHIEGDREDDAAEGGAVAYGIGLGGCSRGTVIDRLHAERYLHAIVGQASLTGVCRFTTIANSTFINGRGWGAINGHGQIDHIRIENNTFLNVQTNLLESDPNYRRAINLLSSNVSIVNNTFNGFRYGITTLFGSDVLIAQNKFADQSGRAISVGGTNMRTLKILDNDIQRIDLGIEIYGDVETLHIIGNTIEEYASGGITLTETAYLVNNLKIVNNTFDNNLGGAFSNAIQTEAGSTVKGFLITENTFLRQFTTPIIVIQGTLIQPMWLANNMQGEGYYNLEDGLPWRRARVRVPSNEDSAVIIADGATYTVEDIVLTAAEVRSASWLSDRVLPMPPGDLDTKGVDAQAVVTANGLVDLVLTNRTGSSQTILADYWMVFLHRMYE